MQRIASASEWNRVMLRAVSFEDNGSVVLEYCIPAQDARENGVVLNHILRVPYGQEYDEEIDAVHDALLALVSDVLEDLPHLQPLRAREAPEGDDEDDEDDDDDDDDA